MSLIRCDNCGDEKIITCPNCGDQHVCQTHAATKAIENILFYIGWRAGRLTERLPMNVRPADIKVPAQHIIALIQGDKTLNEILAGVDDELGAESVTPEFREQAEEFMQRNDETLRRLSD